jgi:hypothetical protein
VLIPNSTEAYTGMLESSRVAAETGVFEMEVRMVLDGHEDATMMVAETENVETKWYLQQLHRWNFAFALVGAVVLLVERVVRSPTRIFSEQLNVMKRRKSFSCW